ncbi:MAG: type II toxin-antitoxin system HipA family toxin [Bacteroidota bacterium]|jgi:serine/threonine-protein kinase HipA
MTAAEVKIWGELAGAVVWDDTNRLGTFEFAPGFKKQQWELSPLKMPLGSSQMIFSFPELRKERFATYDTFRGLPGMLADVLPDRFGNQLINRWLAGMGRPQDSMNPVEMLLFLGSRGMGALEFEPSSLKENKNTFPIELESLVQIAKIMMDKRSMFQTNIIKYEEKAVIDILKIGTSAGGARPKALIAYNEKNGEIRSGQTKAPEGFEHWLIKLDGVSDVQVGESKGYGRVEMAYYLMAIDCGIEMMPSTLLEENNRAHFMTKRFDRIGRDTKHHIQTFCAMQHFDFNLVTSFSYEQLFQTMRELRLSYEEIEQMYRRMVFNVLSRNCDDHTKNFSFMMEKGQGWKLAPAYDICHAYRPDSAWVSQHALSINHKRTNITREDLLLLAQAVNCKKAPTIINEINAVVTNWKKYASITGVQKKLREAIAQTLIQL